MIGIGVIGCGYWGAHLVRNVAGLPGARLVAVSDLSPARLDDVRRRHPALTVETDPHALLADPRIDAVMVATPAATHHALALAALSAGKHVLVEKPLATRAGKARQLIDEADRRGLVLMAGHTFVYSGAVRALRELIAGGELGTVHAYDSVRVNLGQFQPDVNVLWDLAVHDLAILDFVFDERPVAVSATGMGHVAGQPEDVAFATLFFAGSLIAHLHVSWLAPVKLRRTQVSGSRRMVVYDDLEPRDKLRLYDKGITVSGDGNGGPTVVGYREGAVSALELDAAEPLGTEVQHFLDCIEQGRTPLSDGRCGLRVVSLLEAAEHSLRQRGRCVELPAGLDGLDGNDANAGLDANRGDDRDGDNAWPATAREAAEALPAGSAGSAGPELV